MKRAIVSGLHEAHLDLFLILLAVAASAGGSGE